MHWTTLKIWTILSHNPAEFNSPIKKKKKNQFKYWEFWDHAQSIVVSMNWVVYQILSFQKQLRALQTLQQPLAPDLSIVPAQKAFGAMLFDLDIEIMYNTKQVKVHVIYWEAHGQITKKDAPTQASKWVQMMHEHIRWTR